MKKPEIKHHTETNTSLCVTLCKKCNRPISAPESVQRGMGKVCWESTIHLPNERAKNLFGNPSKLAPNRAKFVWGFDGKMLWLIDQGAGHFCKSLTNDMEAALVSIIAEDDTIDLINAKIVYQDSDGQWDGVKVEMLHPEQLKADAKWLLVDGQKVTNTAHTYQPFGIEIDFYPIGVDSREKITN